MSHSIKRKAVAGVIAAGAALGVGITLAAPASADPITQGSYVLAGSDTIQDLGNGFGNGYYADITNQAGTFNAATTSPNGTKLESYDAFGPSYNPSAPGTDLIRTRVGHSLFGRPHGSGDGVKALSASWNATNHTFTNIEGSFTLNGDVDIARSSSRPGTVQPYASAQVVYVPLARDAVSVAIYDTAVTNLSTDQLAAIYGANNGIYHQNASPTVFTVGDINRNTASSANDPVYVSAVTGGGGIQTSIPLFPELPQSASGTRSFFLGAIGVGGTSQPAIGAWVEQSGAAENTASVLTSNGQLIPFSAAQWIAQKNNVAPTTFTGAGSSNVKLLNINGLIPFTTSGSKLVPADSTTTPVAGLYGNVANPAPTGVGNFARDTYLVVKKAAVDTGSAYSATFTDLATTVSTTLPGKTSVITDFGFKNISYSATTADWLGSLYTNP